MNSSAFFIKKTIVFLLLSALSTIAGTFPSISYAEENQTLEDKLKAVYLVRLGEFIQWPKSLETQEKFTICIAFDAPIYPYLEEIAQHEYKIKGKTLQLINTHQQNTSHNCYILYTNTPTAADIHSSALIVGHHESLIQQGGIIRFYIKNNKIRMKINLKAAKRKGLILSSQLLALMEIIEQ